MGAIVGFGGGRWRACGLRDLGWSAMLAAAAWLPAFAAVAQTVDEIRDQVRDLVRESDIGDQLQSLSGFAALPGISAARFDVADDTDIVRLVLPLSHQFAGPRLLGVAPYLEATFGYSRVEQTVRVDGSGPSPTRIDRDLTSLSGLAGFGAGFELLPRTTLRPIALLGYAHLDDDADFAGPDAETIELVADGIFLNVSAQELLYGGALEIVHGHDLGRGLNLETNARYNHLWGATLASSDDALDGDSNFGVFTAAATVDGPLPATLLGRDLRWLAFVTHSRFPGDSSDALGFDYFFELGGGLEIVDRDVIAGIEGVSLRASYITGDGVTGFSLGAQLEF
jgi:hypothetical protein